ncbi:MAG: lamin tail domain-containing protein [Candidatus Promineifilaceae bacterium]
MSIRRMMPFILINIVVSATVVLLILFFWDNRNPSQETADSSAQPLATALVPTRISTVELASTLSPNETPGGPITHTVRPGESLGGISQFYDVPIEDIMTASGIDNPNFLQVGQVLVIPIGGIPTATPPATPTATPNVAPTPIPTEAPVEGEAIIEISEVIGVGSLAEEAVSIVNSGNRPIALLDWQITDKEGTVYTFGQVTLFGEGGGILLHTEAGQDGASDLYWGLEQPVWESGETVTLTDAEGTVRVTYTIP